VFTLGCHIEAATIIGNSVTGPYQIGTNNGTKSVGFLTGSNALLLDDIQVVLDSISPNGFSGTLTFTLNSDSAGNPCGVVATMGSVTLASGAAAAPYTITPASALSLAANTAYWIQAVLPLGGPDWDGNNPFTQPSSGLATFNKYVYNGATSTT